MPLVTTTDMFKKAYDGGYAIGAFNVNKMEIVQGITEACQETRSPVILQVSTHITTIPLGSTSQLLWWYPTLASCTLYYTIITYFISIVGSLI